MKRRGDILFFFIDYCQINGRMKVEDKKGVILGENYL